MGQSAQVQSRRGRRATGDRSKRPASYLIQYRPGTSRRAAAAAAVIRAKAGVRCDGGTFRPGGVPVEVPLREVSAITGWAGASLVRHRDELASLYGIRLFKPPSVGEWHASVDLEATRAAYRAQDTQTLRFTREMFQRSRGRPVQMAVWAAVNEKVRNGKRHRIAAATMAEWIGASVNAVDDAFRWMEAEGVVQRRQVPWRLHTISEFAAAAEATPSKMGCGEPQKPIRNGDSLVPPTAAQLQASGPSLARSGDQLPERDSPEGRRREVRDRLPAAVPALLRNDAVGVANAVGLRHPHGLDLAQWLGVMLPPDDGAERLFVALANNAHNRVIHHPLSLTVKQVATKTLADRGWRGELRGNCLLDVGEILDRLGVAADWQPSDAERIVRVLESAGFGETAQHRWNMAAELSRDGFLAERTRDLWEAANRLPGIRDRVAWFAQVIRDTDKRNDIWWRECHKRTLRAGVSGPVGGMASKIAASGDAMDRGPHRTGPDELASLRRQAAADRKRREREEGLARARERNKRLEELVVWRREMGM